MTVGPDRIRSRYGSLYYGPNATGVAVSISAAAATYGADDDEDYVQLASLSAGGVNKGVLEDDSYDADSLLLSEGVWKVDFEVVAVPNATDSDDTLSVKLFLDGVGITASATTSIAEDGPHRHVGSALVNVDEDGEPLDIRLANMEGTDNPQVHEVKLVAVKISDSL